MKKLIFVIIVFISIIYINGITNVSAYDLYAEWINEEGGFCYPINQMSDEWDCMYTADEMRKATSLPHALVEKMHTLELLEIVLEYPMIYDMLAYENYKTSYENLKKNFNGIAMFLNRIDSADVLVDYYKTINIPEKRIMDYSLYVNKETEIDDLNSIIENKTLMKKVYDDRRVYDSIALCECMLLELYESNKISDEIFWELINYKNKVKIKSEYFDESNCFEVVGSYISINGLNATISTNSANNITITTPSGTVVTNYIYSENLVVSTGDYTAMLAQYHAQYISIAYSTFNCHSYAWLMSDYPEQYKHIWLNTCGAFTSDSAYTISTQPSALSIVNHGLHSAKVIRINQYNPYISGGGIDCWVISKWGAGPIAQHYLKTSPYYNNGDTINYYTRG